MPASFDGYAWIEVCQVNLEDCLYKARFFFKFIFLFCISTDYG